ncbi:MAG: sigma-54-dependent Fis family transcriptional regulator [Alphaproteobacteria bacterium]|nr:MAG: sigma-54-dependent Fis family transcriptional regulator [Alphaproteobacteria bacterium]
MNEAKTLTIAIIDDEADMRLSIGQWLQLSGFRTVAFTGAEEALAEIGPDWPGIVITDIRMPGMDGMALLRRLMSLDPQLPVIIITGHGDVPMAVEAMRLGAYDFLEKPFDPERMADLVRRALKARRLTLDNRQLRRELSDGTVLRRRLIGASPAMARLREDILDIAQADTHVLILGETGTGKSLVAHALHASGPRQGRALVTLNLAAHGAEELEARLFGPLAAPEVPALEAARGGTLVLESIEALPAELQSRLLARLDETPPGEAPEVRVIAVCNLQEEGRSCADVLRPDLYYRLAAQTITVPPLRERGEDVLMLFNRYLEIFAEEYGVTPPAVSAEEASLLLEAEWPGNVRQLVNLAERMILQARRGEVSLAQLLAPAAGAEAAPAPAAPLKGKPLRERIEAFERMLIDSAMRRHRGSVSKVMEELSIPRRTLNEKMARYGLSRADYVR